MRLAKGALSIALALGASAAAQAEPVTLSLRGPAAEEPADRSRATKLIAAERIAYRAVFADIRAGAWEAALARLEAMRSGPLHAFATAELYLSRGSPRVSGEALAALLQAAPDLPQASRIATLARDRGIIDLPDIPAEQRLVSLPASPRRERARPIAGDAVSDALRALAEPMIDDNQAVALEAALVAREALLSPEALAEWRQRTAWLHYIVGNYADARRLGLAAAGFSGDWAVQGDWVAALAAWRQADCANAAVSFDRVAARGRDSDLIAAGHYWAARAKLRCHQPGEVEPRLRSAARMGETFYGLLARQSLGMNATPVKPQRAAAGIGSSSRPNIARAAMLAEIGETQLADVSIRHQARIGGRGDHGDLLKLAAKLNLASTQYWLAHNGPSGAYVEPGARYPSPDWSPSRGWRVDPALVFAHTLQESAFRTAVVSPAGATGLMQVRPGTAGDIARERGEAFDPARLREPADNIEFGQTYLEQLRDGGATGGLLPKVIAAYNAGPVPVAKWNASVRDGGDPLLYIESLPYWETRGYVPTILRNFWIYQAQAGQPSPTLGELAQGKWPRFPTVTRQVAARGSEASGSR